MEIENTQINNLDKRFKKWQLENVDHDLPGLEHYPDSLIKEGNLIEVSKNFYKHWYRPHNMCLIAVGDFGSYLEAKNQFNLMIDIFSKIKQTDDLGIEKKTLNPSPLPRPSSSRTMFFKDKALNQKKNKNNDSIA